MSENFNDNSFYLPVSSSSNNFPNEDNKEAVSSEQQQDDQMDSTLTPVETFEYKPISYQWFYTVPVADNKINWIALSLKDSKRLEDVYTQNIDLIRKLRTQSDCDEKIRLNELIVQIKGGRYEVNLVELTKKAIYWEEKKESFVRRCLWFYKENNEPKFMPYEEEYSQFLEAEYEKTIRTNNFHKRIDFIKTAQFENKNKSESHENINEENDSQAKKLKPQASMQAEEAFVIHSPTIILHFTQANQLDEFGNLNSDANRPRIVKRGIDETADKLEPDEIEEIDHLCFVVHGIGEGCDMKFRPIVDCVDDLREIGAFINEAHYKQHTSENNLAGRVEFLPISWHQELHGETTGIDNRLKPMTLPSIPKLRQYSNSTILDVLFYTSPVYCQTIISKVGNQLNRLVKMFMERNPTFKGTISLIGHSLGSLIVFDLLSHQYENKPSERMDDDGEIDSLYNAPANQTIEYLLERLDLNEYKDLFEKEKITYDSLRLMNDYDLNQLGLPLGPRKLILNEITNNSFHKEMNEVKNKIKDNLNNLNKEKESEQLNENFNYGLAGSGQLVVKYPKLTFKVQNFFALGSPIPAFLTVRGIEKLDLNYKFPTCEKFFNIFHPFDPVAYRLEPLICPSIVLKPVLMPHHKGRKRMHLELKEGITKVAEDLRHNMYGQIKNAWTSITEFAKLPILSGPTSTSNLQIESSTVTATATTTTTTTTANPTELKQPSSVSDFTQETDIEKQKEDEEKELLSKVNFGKLNNGRRIDYQLQESPIESFNEYIFALASHACYWESEDTLLLILKEIYNVNNLTDSDIEFQLTEQQQQQTSWLTQAAASTLSSNMQKTFSYFNIGLPQSISSVLTVPNLLGQNNSSNNK